VVKGIKNLITNLDLMDKLLIEQDISVKMETFAIYSFNNCESNDVLA